LCAESTLPGRVDCSRRPLGSLACCLPRQRTGSIFYRRDLYVARTKRLPLADRAALAARIWYWYFRIRLRLRRRDLVDVVESLGRTGRITAYSIEPRRLGRIVDRALPFRVSRATCLAQSLILYRLLRTQGLAPQLVIGLPHQSATHEAHAWIELDGKDVGPPPGGRNYVPLARYGGRFRAGTTAKEL
jgi:hypothetical protein